MDTKESKLRISLFLLRVGVFVVMLFWTFDKFLNPEHSSAVFANFYGMKGLGASLFAVIGSIQMVIILAFVVGAFRTWSYGLVLAMHAVSTLSSWKQYPAGGLVCLISVPH